MGLFDRVVGNLEERRDRVLSGKINCIPCPFPRFRSEWSGIEQGRYYGVTAQQKVGKTKLANYMFLFHPLLYAMQHPNELRVKFFYISLEMSEEELYQQFICHLLYIVSRGQHRFSPKELKSTDKENPIAPEILAIIRSDEYKAYFEFFDSHVEIISSIRNPTGINKLMRDYARANGTQYKKIINFKDNKTGEITPTEVDSHYIANDPDEYVIIITDHISLIQPESGMTLKDSMTKLSSDYFVGVRNKYRYIPVVIQQQAIAGESTDNIKLGKLKPSVADLGESKILSRDYNVLFGLFSPYRHEMHDYMGYSIDKFRDNARFMEIIISREGGGGTTCPLYFDGAIDYFRELPLPFEVAKLKQVYDVVNVIQTAKPKIVLHFFKVIINNIKNIKNV